jgi:hypothetical protein
MKSFARARLTVFSLIIVLSGCGASGPAAGRGDGPPPWPIPPAGTIMGVLISQRSDGSHRVPIAGQAVGVFRYVVIAGKPLKHPPTPIVTVATTSDGSFAFHKLKPGHYFITVASGTLPSVTGRWVELTSNRGASILLIHCTDCPGPL